MRISYTMNHLALVVTRTVKWCSQVFPNIFIIHIRRKLVCINSVFFNFHKSAQGVWLDTNCSTVKKLIFCTRFRRNLHTCLNKCDIYYHTPHSPRVQLLRNLQFHPLHFIMTVQYFDIICCLICLFCKYGFCDLLSSCMVKFAI